MRRLPGYPRPSLVQAFIAGAVCLVILLPGQRAHATYPGHNGEIAYLGISGSDSDSETETELAQVCASGLHERDLPPRGTWDAVNVAFSPNGRMVATDGIAVAPLAEASLRRVSRPPPRTADSGPVWAPRGGALAFTRVRYRRSIVRSAAVRIYEKGHGRLLTRGFAPAWSVRNRIAFVRGKFYNESTQAIHVVSLKSGAVRRLAAGYAPHWSPDGRRILFTYEVPAEPEYSLSPATTEIRTIAADGTGLRRVGSGAGASWSPNGGWIGFRDSKGYAAVVSASGRGLRRLARTNGAPVFSPDSRWLAYTWRDELYVARVRGGSRRYVTSPLFGEEIELLDWRAAPASETRC